MKKIIFILSFLLFATFCNAQSLIGKSDTVIAIQMTKEGLTCKQKNNAEKGKPCKNYNNDNITVNFKYDEKEICIKEKWTYPNSMFREIKRGIIEIPNVEKVGSKWQYVNDNKDLISCEIIKIEDYFCVFYEIVIK